MAKPNLPPSPPFILHRSCLVNEKVPRAEVATNAFQVIDQQEACERGMMFISI